MNVTIRRYEHRDLGRVLQLWNQTLPVGPPDDQAREAIWQRYAAEIADEPIDIERLVRESVLFTPADIEFAARKAAQRAFEREHFEGPSGRARTEDIVKAISQTRPTLSWEIVEAFDRDTQRHARY